MDLRNIRAFYLVATHGNLMRAANQLKLTIPAVSIQLKKLETDLGVKLLHHLPNKLLLTDRGRVFLERVTPILTALEDAKRIVNDENSEVVGKICISLSNNIARVYAPEIASFIRKYPGLEVTILDRPSPEILSMVVDGGVDIGVGRFKSISPGIASRRLLKSGVWLVYPQRLPFPMRDIFNLKHLENHRLILLQRGAPTRKTIDVVLSRHRVDVKSVLEVGSCQSVIDFVRLGLGVGLVHDICAVAESREGIRTVDLSEYFGKSEVALVYRKTALLRAPHHNLIEALSTASFKLRQLTPGAKRTKRNRPNPPSKC